MNQEQEEKIEELIRKIENLEKELKFTKRDINRKMEFIGKTFNKLCDYLKNR